MVQEVASWIGAPGPYLSKVFHALGKARIVDTKRGRRGGVVLVHAFWTEERVRIFTELQNVTLADVARFERTHRLAPVPLVPAPTD